MPDEIVCDPQIMSGKPCIAGTRIPVCAIVDFAAHGIGAIQHEYPTLSVWQIAAALAWHASCGSVAVSNKEEADRIEQLEKRLEIVPGFSEQADGIACRDDTIRLQDERIKKLEAENTLLRAALAMSEQPCAYCALPAEEWNKCASGFPGCARGDDAMGCPELGAAVRVEQLETALKQIASCQSYAEGDVVDLARKALQEIDDADN